MRRMVITVLILALICGLAACGEAATPIPGPTSSPAGTPSVRQLECERQGGEWLAHGFDQRFMCNLPASDAGQPCSDSDQCDGLCLAPPDIEPRTSGEVPGQCSPRQINFGCYNLVEDGRLAMACID
jgi:hypothetical protein